MPTSIFPESFWLGASTLPPAMTKSNFSAGSAGLKPTGTGLEAGVAGWASAGWVTAWASSVAPAADVPDTRNPRRETSIGLLLGSVLEHGREVRFRDAA